VFHGFGQAKSAHGGSILGPSQITLLPQLPLKTMLSLKVIKSDSNADHGRADWLGYWDEFVQKACFKKLACLCHIKQNNLTYLGRFVNLNTLHTLKLFQAVTMMTTFPDFLSVPAPRQLTLERQLNKSILIGWTPPDCPPGHIEMYHVYVDGFLRTTVRSSDKTKALVEGVDSARVSNDKNMMTSPVFFNDTFNFKV